MSRYDAYRSAELAAVYDAVYAYSHDIGFWLATASTSVDGPILELGCGTGRILLPLARAGYDITGIDLSVHMLDVCRAKAQAEPPEVRNRITVLESDMSAFRLQRALWVGVLRLRRFPPSSDGRGATCVSRDCARSPTARWDTRARSHQSGPRPGSVAERQ